MPVESLLHRQPAGWGYRHQLAIMAFLGFANIYGMRVNLSVAMVAMVKSSIITTYNTSMNCPDDSATGTNHTNKGEFNWDSETQSYILSSFFYGYILTQIPGGWLAEKFGGKYLLGYGVLCTAILTMFTPFAARQGVWSLIVVRFLMGVADGVTFPSMHAMWGKWAPFFERSKLAGISYAGAQIGIVISFPISGVLCNSDFLGGWPAVFYVFGVLAFIWFLVWMLIIYNKPGDHPNISQAETDYIMFGIESNENIPTPWCSIFSSPAVWAICVGHFANNWGLYTTSTSLPRYMKNILKFDLTSNSILSALPYLACWIGLNISGFLADYLTSNNFLSTLNTRRLLTFVGLFIPGIVLICIPSAGCNHVAVVALFVICLGTGGLTIGGFWVNHMDLSPKFAGVLMGISNSMATIPGILGPQIVGWLTDEKNTEARWQIGFYIATAVYIIGAILYCLLCSGSEQSWNRPPVGLSFRTRHTPQSESDEPPIN